ncbi:MAG: L-threonine 3-dehydrogenase [Gammaproteobacteria bacterium]|nr:L-threonine 3-dehydrogenase [Gammaproteobacteria bacterium]NNF62335.1 L-threonine 3-dehydrogenase [Gammaproteobacteria bacterium]NNM21005.1 L-threonine 3-dehydrogenase [Gammaproteobacteria bacterium]
MRALVKSSAEPGIWMEQVPVPAVGHNDALIRVQKAAICGTDIHIYNWDDWSQKNVNVPTTIGHEFMGEVVEVGSEVTGLKPGDRVAGEGHITCAFCRNCRAGRRHLCRNTQGVGVDRAGAFADYVSIPAVNAFVLPDAITDDMAAILDPLGNATHTALSFDLVGEDILITGAGPIGVMAVAICRHVGARHVVITDVNEYRLGLAEKMGATKAVNVANTSVEDVMRQLDMREGFDVGLEMSGNEQAFQTMLQTMHHGGSIGLLGIASATPAIDWNQIIFKGLVLKGIYGREMFETWYKMASMIQSGLDISPVITHHYPAAEFQAGFEIMKSGQSGKVILDWS